MPRNDTSPTISAERSRPASNANLHTVDEDAGLSTVS